MGATPSQIENDVADPDSESDDDEVIKIQNHRRYRVSFFLLICVSCTHIIPIAVISKNYLMYTHINVSLVFIMQPYHFLTQCTLFCRGLVVIICCAVFLLIFFFV